jgi:N utilization substance protein A
MKTESEILRFVDTIHRDKEIDKEAIFQAIEAAFLTSVKKKYGESESIRVVIDRHTGNIQAYDGERELEVEDLGRIAASTGKQVLFQKIREAERDIIYEEYHDKVNTLVSGVVQRIEGGNMIVGLGKVEGFLPRSEQSPGEKFRVGERIKVIIQEIGKNASRVRIVLSRTTPELVKALFELEVPEIADRTIDVKGIAREPGYRTKIAVTTYDPNVDCVGACVGVRGSRIKNIVDELFGEKIDIVRWNESIEVLIMNALKPAEISSMDLDFESRRAKVYVKPDQQSIAIGKRGQNVRLASKLTGWEIDIVTVSEEELEKLRTEQLDENGQPIAIAVLGSSGVAAEDSRAEGGVETSTSAKWVSATAEESSPERSEDESLTSDAGVGLGTDDGDEGGEDDEGDADEDAEDDADEDADEESEAEAGEEDGDGAEDGDDADDK